MSAETKRIVVCEEKTVDGTRIALVTIDNPPINAGSLAMRRDLLAAIRTASAMDGISGIILTGANGNFVGGADIREFDAPAAEPHLPEVIAAMEAYSLPVVAAIDGAALGGGYELALGCDARVVTPSAVLGLPEATLGLIPGAGGTLRLSRLVPVADAILAITSGKRTKGAEAVKLGMADALAEGDLLAQSVAYLIALAGKKRLLTHEPAIQSSKDEIEAAVKQARRRAFGSQAVEAAIEAVHRGASVGADGAQDAMVEERKVSLDLRIGEQSKALRHLFFAERNALKVPEGAKARPIETVGIVGAGQMGRGIALAFASRGYRVRLTDTNEEFLGRAFAELERSAQALADRSKTASSSAITSKISTVSGPQEMADCDLIVEAIVEDMAAKKALFAELAKLCRPDAILASNTSYLDLDEIGSVVTGPERVAGLHFFNPANVMRLVEIVRTKATSEETEATLLQVAKRLGKVPIVATVSEGFIGNRIFSAYRKQCEFLVEEGALPEDVDRAMRDFGMAMGPFAVFDLAGLDIAWATRKRLAPTRDPRARYVTIADSLCERGRLGRKTGAGWFSYANSARGELDPEVREIVEAASASAGIERRQIGQDEIRERLLGAMVNEAALLLVEGVARSSADIDLALVHGYGFPAVKGGPIHYTSRQPLQDVLASVDDLSARSGHGIDRAPNLEEVLRPKA